MAMTNEKIVEALEACGRLAAESTLATSNLDPDEAAHIVGMVPRAKALLAEGRREKVMRWLGFMQGALWQAGVAELDDLKQMNRPDPHSDPTEGETP